MHEKNRKNRVERRMKKDINAEIARIMGEMRCPKDFVCYTSGFETLCEVKDYGLESFVKCLAEERVDCPFSLSFGSGQLCKCPLRIYIKKELNLC